MGQQQRKKERKEKTGEVFALETSHKTATALLTERSMPHCLLSYGTLRLMTLTLEQRLMCTFRRLMMTFTFYINFFAWLFRSMYRGWVIPGL